MYPSSIEVVRAALSCFFFHPTEQPKPVHTLKLRAFFSNYYPPNQLEGNMNTLVFLKEAVKLPNGFWAPTPLRKIDLGKFSIILAPYTSTELARVISTEIITTGYGRISEDIEALKHLPSENLNDWLGNPISLKDWINDLLNYVNANLTKSTSAGRAIQFYAPQKNSTAHLNWRTLEADSSPSIQSNLYLLRERTTFGQTRYFFGEVKSRKLLRETPDFNFDYIRVQYGIDFLADIKGVYLQFSEEKTTVIRLLRRLPQAENRLITALNVQEGITKTNRDYKFMNNHFQAVEDCLNNLGLSGLRVI